MADGVFDHIVPGIDTKYEELGSYIDSTTRRLVELMEETEAVTQIGEIKSLLAEQEHHYEFFSQLWVDVFFYNFVDINEKERKELKNKFEWLKNKEDEFNEKLSRLESKFGKSRNLNASGFDRSRGGGMVDYYFDLYMKFEEKMGALTSSWQEQSKKGRESREKISLIEWFQIPDRSEDELIKNQFKSAAIDSGILISNLLIDLLTAISGKRDVGSTLQLLETFTLQIKTLKTNSIIINTFSSVFESTERRIRAENLVNAIPIKKKSRNLVEITYDLQFKKLELKILYMIFREVLRLELIFLSPKLPRSVISGDEIQAIWVSNLRKMVERDEKRVRSKIDELKRELESGKDGVDDLKVELRKRLGLEMEEIWKSLAL